MASALPPACPHGLRPGTTVCLHCLHDARAAARQRRIRLGARFGIIALGGGVLVALIVGGLTSIAPEARSFGRSVTQSVAGAVNRSPAPATKARPVSIPALEPIIAQGRKELGDSVYAERSGDQVTVNFDTEGLRTRFDWKFEGIVRSTLPIVFGADARTALDSIPSGRFVNGGTLLYELPTRGIPLALPNGRSLRVWPVVRQGRDGPLVMGYRASADR